jgi:hypothetical protein
MLHVLQVNPAQQPPRAPLEPVNEGEAKAEAEGMHPRGIAEGQPRSSVGSTSSGESPQQVADETVYEASNYGAVLARAAAAPPPRFGNGLARVLSPPLGGNASPPRVSPTDDGKLSRPAWDPAFADESPFARGFGAPPPPRQRASAQQQPRRKRTDSNPRREGVVPVPDPARPDGDNRRLPGAWDAACIDTTRAYDGALGGVVARPHSTPEKKRAPVGEPVLPRRPQLAAERMALATGMCSDEQEYTDLLEMRIVRNGAAVAGDRADEARKVQARRKKRLVSADEVGAAACGDIGGVNCPPRPPPKAPPCPSVVDSVAAAARLPEKKARAKADPSDPETRQMFDKRRSRRDNRAPFEAAVAQWRLMNAAVPRAPGGLSGGEEGGVSVFARKRPLFSHEMSRGEYDVVTVASTQEIVVHNCQMHADLKRMIIKHQVGTQKANEATRRHAPLLTSHCVQSFRKARPVHPNAAPGSVVWLKPTGTEHPRGNGDAHSSGRRMGRCTLGPCPRAPIRHR